VLLKKGDIGSDVKELQSLLDSNGFWTYDTITDYFGDITETAVKNFQSAKKITVDGLVGDATYSHLIDGVKYNIMLKKGDSGSQVKEVQQMLGINDDGIFGSGTESSVKKFQSDKGLVSDGIVGSKTYETLVNETMGIDFDNDEDIDTDRTGFDDSDDRDDKLNYLGSYTTEDGLEIDRAYLDGDEYVKDYGELQPENFFIHHTAGWNNPYNTINSWNKDDRGRVATQYCIGGTSTKVGSYGDDKYNGQVVECFPDNYIGWHLGKVGNFNMSKYSSAVEINNFGYVTKKNGKYYTYVNTEVPENMVCDLGYEFRGHQYWHAYTPEQIESLRLLIKHVEKIYPKIDMTVGIPKLLKDGTNPKDAFDFNEDAYYGKIKGLYSHTSVRRDKFDCFPQPELVEMLKAL
jgi:peptidoglycan hydrolase-like protein with peptidoglycan-binding domain